MERTHGLFMLRSMRGAAASLGKLLALTAITAAASIAHVPDAQAARCNRDSIGNWKCSFQERKHTFNSNSLFGCVGMPISRHVRYEVPEGTPPAGGWPVVFYYNGFVAVGSPQQNPFDSRWWEPFGAVYGSRVLHELLDDPRGTGKKYAVIAAEAPTVGFVTQFWDTNVPFPYEYSSDACFLPDLFEEAKMGAYGPVDMTKRYAFGISSGGYNTSRMAVTFNKNSEWSALAIVAGSYATCSGPLCFIPDKLPSNHPPTKFYHGVFDFVVPVTTMNRYHEKLKSQGVPTDRELHYGGHEFGPPTVGRSGIKAWFDRF
ncbi:hypothetical protein M8A51_01770 [Schlegelella sp. S2-27]|uniref:Esterase n=1 Tax=Caldimonas mangrovi TaxID=2944811 RepID=A0ABT0YHP2_9BURK|nr:hypothetical protein [Caldimonas mangrovi]MCM5678251.1 hypothetical protein [Caldimonas mangrovi]